MTSFKTSTGASTSNASGLTFSHAQTASASPVLYVLVMWFNDNSTARTISGVTFNGVSLTRITGAASTLSSGTDRIGSDIWRLVNPAVTTANVVITFSGNVNRDIHARAVSLQAAKQTSTELSSGANNSDSLAVTIDSYSLQLDTFYSGDGQYTNGTGFGTAMDTISVGSNGFGTSYGTLGTATWNSDGGFPFTVMVHSAVAVDGPGSGFLALF